MTTVETRRAAPAAKITPAAPHSSHKAEKNSVTIYLFYLSPPSVSVTPVRAAAGSDGKPPVA